MGKEDLSRPRSIEELLIRFKLNFESSNKEMKEELLNKVENELNNIVNSLIINLADVIDSQNEISLWFYSGLPTLENEPYTKWTTVEEHYGDLYYDQDTGKVYKFIETGWSEQNDINLIQSMALTNANLDVEMDHKRSVFFSNPSPPYSSGDWWIKKDGTLFICQIGKNTGEFEENDFINSSKSTMTIAIKDGNKLTVLQGTVTEITEKYVKYTDLATGGSTTISGDNITTGKIKSSNYVQNSIGMEIDLDNGTIKTKNFILDQYGNAKLSNGATVISEKGLMNTYTYDTRGYQIVGFIGNDTISPTGVVKEEATIDLIIPKNFNVTSAIVELFHSPIYWGLDNKSVWGYSRNLKLYKANNLYSRQINAEYMGGIFLNNNTTYVEIPNAFGANGYTPSTPSNNSHITEKKECSDISSSFKDSNGNTIKGLHQLKISSDFNFTESFTQENIASKTGCVFAILKIDGYMKYELEEEND